MVSNPLNNIFSQKETDTDKTKWDETISYPTPSNKTPTAYDQTRSLPSKFEGSVIIHQQDGEFLPITFNSLTAEKTVEVRVEDYTTRFGVVDAEDINVSGGSIHVNYQLPNDADKDIFYRKLFVTPEGISSERVDAREDDYGIGDSDWVKEKDSDDEHMFTLSNLSRMEVYDWRENMMTHNKPTPDEYEIVFQYSTPFGIEFEKVLNIGELNNMMDGGSVITKYIQLETDNFALRLFAEGEKHSYEITLPLLGDSDESDMTWKIRSSKTLPSPYWYDNIIWVRNPEDTWYVDSYRADDLTNCVKRVQE